MHLKKYLPLAICTFVVLGLGFAILPHPALFSASEFVPSGGNDGVVVSNFVGDIPEKTSGSAAGRGVKIAGELASPLYGSSFSAGQRGVVLAGIMTDEDATKTGKYSTEIELIASLNVLRDLMPWEALSNAPDRFLRLNEILADYNTLLAAAEESRQMLLTLRQKLQSELDILDQRKKEAERRYFTALNKTQSYASDRYFQQFTDAQLEWNQKRADLGRVSAIYNRLNRLINPVRRQKVIIEQNREALVAGIQVDSRSARAAGVVK